MPRIFPSIESAALGEAPLHLAVGMFDGVHRGHQAVIGEAVRNARASGGLAAVLTFRPHPSRLFRPSDPTLLLQSPEVQAVALARLGVDAVITHPFTREFAAIPAEQFLPWLKARQPRLSAVYVGAGWRFGAGRRGDASVLAQSGRAEGVMVAGIPAVCDEGEVITSTRVRALLTEGEIARANRLLGYPYFALGQVAPGRKLGRTIGFPTLNVPWEPELKPRLGVYRVAVRRAGESGALAAVANYGVRPTVEAGAAPQLEIHVLARECPLGEGDRVEADWLAFIRPEAKIASLDELKAQIARDAAAARTAFGGEPTPPPS